MEVKNMVGRTGKRVPNQFIIIDSEGRAYFQSYQSIIAVIGLDGIITLDKIYWNYSTTTAKYRNQFLRETTKETQKKIDNGTYKLTDLN